MAIPFTQWLRYSSKWQVDYISRSEQVEAQAVACIDKGYRFEKQILGNGLVQLTSMYKGEPDTVAMQIGPNDDKIAALVDSLVGLTFDTMLERQDERAV